MMTIPQFIALLERLQAEHNGLLVTEHSMVTEMPTEDDSHNPLSEPPRLRHTGEVEIRIRVNLKGRMR